MTYHVDRTAQLAEAVKKGHNALATQLRTAGTPTRQHNGKTTRKVAKKAASKKTQKKTAKKTTAKKAVSKKTVAKKS